MEKKLWDIYHEFDASDGDGWSSYPEYEHLGTVSATAQEIDDFIEKWNKPVVYGHTTKDGDLYEHTIGVREVEIKDIADFKPPWAEE